MKNIPKLRFPEFVNDGEWEKKTFGNVATFYNGKAYKQEELLDKGKYRVLRVGNFFTNEHWYYSDLELDENKYCDNGDLLYAWSASFAPKIWIGEKVIYHYHIWKVVENKDINKRFLFILLDYETENMKQKSANGLGLLHITKGTIENWECKLPQPKEQQKIADCLSSVDGLISAQSQKVELLKEHKKGLMQQLFPSEGESVPKRRFPEFVNDGEWEEKKLDEKFSFLRGSSFSKADISENGINKCIHYGELFTIYKEKISDIKSFTNVENGQFSHKNDILMPSSDVTPEGLATASTIFEDGVIIGGDVNILRPKKEICSLFVSYLLNFSKKEIMKLVSGTTVKHIYNKDIAKLLVKLPSPREQQKIADCLSSLDEEISQQTSKLQTLKEHKKGLMQQLFPNAHEK